MKNRYERLSKEEKKKAIEEFKQASPSNAELIKRLSRLKVIGIVGIIYAIFEFIFDYLRANHMINAEFYILSNNQIINNILSSILLIMCVYFIVKSNQLISNQLNKYLINEMKKKNK